MLERTLNIADFLAMLENSHNLSKEEQVVYKSRTYTLQGMLYDYFCNGAGGKTLRNTLLTVSGGSGVPPGWVVAGSDLVNVYAVVGTADLIVSLNHSGRRFRIIEK